MMYALNNSLIKTNNLKCLINVLISNSYSKYPPSYVEPITRRDRIKELRENNEFSKLAFIPIKAAKTHDTCSLFHDERVHQFINYILKKGKKDLARDLVDKTFTNIKMHQIKLYHTTKSEEEKAKIILNPVEIFHRAVDNCTPLLQLTPIKRGGVRYQVPVPLNDHRAQFLAMRWIIEEGKIKDRKVHLPEKLCYVLLEAANNKGAVVKKKIDLHKQCEANKAYAHYRWG